MSIGGKELLVLILTYHYFFLRTINSLPFKLYVKNYCEHIVIIVLFTKYCTFKKIKKKIRSVGRTYGTLF